MRRPSQQRIEKAESEALQAARRANEAGIVARRLQRALDVLPDGVVVCDEDGEVLYRNRVAQALVDARDSDVLAARVVEEVLREARFGVPQDRTLDLYGPPPRTLTIEAAPIAGGTVAVIRDVTQRSHLDAVRRDFVANVSHELRTPVGALAVLADALGSEDDPETIRRLAGRINAEVVRAEQMIIDLLDLSRLESGTPMETEPIRLAELVDAAVERVASKADDRGVAIDRSAVDATLTMDGRRGELVSAVANLLDNAVTYSDPGAAVAVLARADDAWFDIVVRDDGIGIPGKDLERIFERFYRVDRARSRDTGGTGLGLAIVRHVATNHGGTISVASREGEGSTFVLRLPR